MKSPLTIGAEGGGDPGPGDPPGWTVRAINPSELVVEPLAVSKAGDAALTAFYGSPLTFLGYTPRQLTADNTWWNVTGSLPVGEAPSGVAFTSDGTIAYVTNNLADTVCVVDVASRTLRASIPVGVWPEGVAFTPDGTTAYVTNRGDGTVSVIDVVRGMVTTTLPVGDHPWGVAFTPDGATAYVTNYRADTVSVIDVARGVVAAALPVGKAPSGLAVAPDGTTVCVANYATATVSVIDAAHQTVIATLPVGSGPQEVAFTPDGATAYVTNRWDHTVSVIDAATLRPIATIPVGREPAGVAFSPDGATAFVANSREATVSVIDGARRAVAATLSVGETPIGVAVAPGGALAFVVNRGAGTMSVLERRGERVFLGPPGEDQGFDPPFGTHKAGAIVAEQTDRVVCCVLLDAKTKGTLAVTWTSGGDEEEGVLATVTADQITRVWTDQGSGQAPQKWVGDAEALFPPPTSPQVLLRFGSDTGQLMNVRPLRAGSAGLERRIKNASIRVSHRGNR